MIHILIETGDSKCHRESEGSNSDNENPRMNEGTQL